MSVPESKQAQHCYPVTASFEFVQRHCRRNHHSKFFPISSKKGSRYPSVVKESRPRGQDDIQVVCKLGKRVAKISR